MGCSVDGLEVGSPTAVTFGLLLVALGAVGATVAARGAGPGGYPWRVPLRLVPFGVLIGGGAALVRGWDLAVGLFVGALLIPFVALVARWWEVRRRGGGARDDRR